ncbi:unnamed protein product, partial [Didymodactylos carnosus]
ASFQQLLTNFRSISSTNDAEPLVETSNEKIQDLAVSICRNTLSVVNGLLFTIGSVAFWPSYGHCGALVGNWFYRTGAVLEDDSTGKVAMDLKSTVKGQEDGAKLHRLTNENVTPGSNLLGHQDSAQPRIRFSGDVVGKASSK